MKTMPRGGAAAAVLAAAALLTAGCGGGGSDTVEQETATAGAPEAPEVEQPLSAAEQHGRDLFIQTCGACHTLDAAGTFGQIGPNLGDIPLTESDVRTAIRIGGRGSGNMPANLLQGKDARDVAAFVAASGPGAGL
jgi:mono/diheme cytochrome c family protein